MVDLNLETFGLTKKPTETAKEYVQRVIEQRAIFETTHHGLAEFTPQMMQLHELETCNDTYYFSITSGERNNYKQSRLEIMSEPRKISKLSVGFDLD